MEILDVLSNLSLKTLFFQTIAIFITAWLVPGLKLGGLISGFIAVVGISLFNQILWTEDLFFTYPDIFSRVGFYLLIVNGIFFWVLVKILPDFDIEGFIPAMIAPVVFTFLSGLCQTYLPQISWGELLKEIRGFTGELKESFDKEIEEL